MSDHAYVAGRQLHRLADLVGALILDKGCEHHRAIPRIEAKQTMFEPPAIDADPVGLMPIGESLGRALDEPSTPRVGPPHVHDRVAAGPEDVGVEPIGVLDALVPQGLKHGQEDLLNQVLGCRVVAQMAQAVSANAVRVPMADGAFAFQEPHL